MVFENNHEICNSILTLNKNFFGGITLKYLRYIINWIDSFESGLQFRKWVSILVKIMGVLTLIGAIVWGIAICVGSIAASDYLGTGSRTLVIIGSFSDFALTFS